MQTLYIHIGYHKTGTTSLQSLLDQNAPALLDMGVFYPDTIGDGKRSYFRKHLQFFMELKAAHAARGDMSAPVAAMAKSIIASGAPTAMISEESFSGIPDAVMDALAQFRTWFNVKIIACLRGQDSYLQSFYQQSIRDFGETRDFSEFIGAHEWPRLHFDAALQRWADRFGAENLHVFSFELSDGGNNVNPQILNLLLGGRRADFIDTTRVWNKSLPTICYETIRFLNRSEGPEPERRAVYAALREYVLSKDFAETRLPDRVLTKTYLTPEISQFLANAFAASNTRISARFFGGVNPFPDMMPPDQPAQPLSGLSAAAPSFAPKDMIGLLSYVLTNPRSKKPKGHARS
jgi:hypothetical protein